MSLLARLIPNILNPLQQTLKHFITAPSMGAKALTEGPSAQPGGLFSLSVRTMMRCHFPRPSERKRIKRHGFWKRMSTRSGQKIIMRKILKARHVISH